MPISRPDRADLPPREPGGLWAGGSGRAPRPYVFVSPHRPHPGLRSDRSYCFVRTPLNRGPGDHVIRVVGSRRGVSLPAAVRATGSSGVGACLSFRCRPAWSRARVSVRIRHGRRRLVRQEIGG
jgi:hypothetical protein